MLRDERSPPLPAGDRDDDWLDAAQALAHLRLVQQQPAPAQDGGAYERVLADARPVSTATASAAAAAHESDGGARGPMDPVLIACLENPRERLTLLKFEDQIVRFLKNPRELQLVFPPLSSYHRLIIHRLAERCGLEHQTADYNQYAPGAGGYDGSAARAVTLLKTALSAVPTVLLIDLSSDRQQQQTGTPAVVPKIMVRKRAASRPGANGGRGPGDAKNAQRSMQDRERAYAEARARIFGEDSADSSTSSASAVSPSSNASTPASTNGKGGSGNGNGGASKMNSNSQQASGPDGSRGFGGRGRGRGGAAAERSPQRQQQQQVHSSEPSRSAQSTPERSSSTPRVQSAHNWKESKVLWRNREQELNDPDFTRNHDAYRPSRSSSNSSTGGGGDNANSYNRYPLPHQAGGRFPPAPQMEYYDSPQQQQQRQQYGYVQQQQQQQQQQPPLPGRRFPAGEFNRLDNMRPPPPPDHFRGGGGRFPMGNPPPPPPPPGAAGMSLNRGGYGGYPSPHNRQHQSSSNPSPVRSGSAGYNADFPPLGK